MLKRTRIKVCGITKPEQAANAVELGVDAIGVILHANSPRAISLEQAMEIRQVVPAFVSLVGVFVNAKEALIEQAICELKLDIIQLHGDESNAFGKALSRPFIKAIRVKNAKQVQCDMQNYSDASALLFDPYVSGQHGGTGQTLDPQLWPKNHSQALILAGGLSPQNVANRIQQLRPYAVDLNSGLESAPGDKNIQLMKAAIIAIKQADDV